MACMPIGRGEIERTGGRIGMGSQGVRTADCAQCQGGIARSAGGPRLQARRDTVQGSTAAPPWRPACPAGRGPPPPSAARPPALARPGRPPTLRLGPPPGPMPPATSPPPAFPIARRPHRPGRPPAPATRLRRTGRRAMTRSRSTPAAGYRAGRRRYACCKVPARAPGAVLTRWLVLGAGADRAWLQEPFYWAGRSRRGQLATSRRGLGAWSGPTTLI